MDLGNMDLGNLDLGNLDLGHLLGNLDLGSMDYANMDLGSILDDQGNIDFGSTNLIGTGLDTDMRDSFPSTLPHQPPQTTSQQPPAAHGPALNVQNVQINGGLPTPTTPSSFAGASGGTQIMMAGPFGGRPIPVPVFNSLAEGLDHYHETIDEVSRKFPFVC